MALRRSPGDCFQPNIKAFSQTSSELRAPFLRRILFAEYVKINKIFKNPLQFQGKWYKIESGSPVGAILEKEECNMRQPTVITVGREFCTGGAEIAKKLAERLGYAYYDKQIIDHTAEVLKISADTVQTHDEKPVPYTAMFGYQYGVGLYATDPSLSLPLGMQVANTQFDLVRRYAEKGSCVIVGRCADDILAGREDLLTVFIRADMEYRIARAMRLYQIDRAEAQKLIRRTDKVRASYYANYTGKKWGDVHSYMMTLDAGALGVDGCVEAILGAVKGSGKEQASES